VDIHLGQGISPETAYVDADHHAAFDKPLADGAGQTFEDVALRLQLRILPAQPLLALGLQLTASGKC
jgi:hypothetical protein